MKPIYGHFAAATALTFGLAACIPPAPEPTPAPSPAPVTRPSPAPTQAPVAEAPTFENWIDAPQTPGNWSYAAAGGRTQASYSTPDGAQRFSLTCDTRTRTIEVARAAAAATSGETPLRVLTETANRTLAGQVEADPMPMIVVRLQARDPLLDAMALTRGRFAVETPGSPTLYLPAWAEVTRVIEDCR